MVRNHKLKDEDDGDTINNVYSTTMKKKSSNANKQEIVVMRRGRFETKESIIHILLLVLCINHWEIDGGGEEFLREEDKRNIGYSLFLKNKTIIGGF